MVARREQPEDRDGDGGLTARDEERLGARLEEAIFCSTASIVGLPVRV